MKRFDRIFVVAACLVGVSSAVPAANADVAGCTENFVAAASNPQSDSTVLQFDYKHPENGIYLNPLNAPGRALDYAGHEYAALDAYLNCI